MHHKYEKKQNKTMIITVRHYNVWKKLMLNFIKKQTDAKYLKDIGKYIKNEVWFSLKGIEVNVILKKVNNWSSLRHQLVWRDRCCLS